MRIVCALNIDLMNVEEGSKEEEGKNDVTGNRVHPMHLLNTVEKAVQVASEKW